MWSICFREYDRDGHLTELISTKSEKIKTKWKRIKSFVNSTPSDRVREVQFYRRGKQMPSLLSDGNFIRFGKPIVAALPLFEYARTIGITTCAG